MTEIAMLSEIAYGSDFTRRGKFTIDIDFARHGNNTSLIEKYIIK
ncbi:hypothetical protein [Fenollaria timonensis]|nr:hypothetical protein [Fenollaria timonensis]